MKLFCSPLQVDSTKQKEGRDRSESTSCASDSNLANFNRIARSYRWLEFLTFGPILQQTRTHFLPLLHDRRHAFLFGDGDGRFLARLLAQNPHLTADAIDTSATMLNLLRRRTDPFALLPLPNASRLRTHNRTALAFIPDQPADLVVTHFFLDCLSQPELDHLIHQLTPSLAPEALWLVSEFRIPPGALALPARFFIQALYFAFRLLTGLRVTHLPAYHSAFTRAGFVRIACHLRLSGLLTTELWQHRSGKEEDTGCDAAPVGLSSHITYGIRDSD